jgi:hypothetical protein
VEKGGGGEEEGELGKEGYVEDFGFFSVGGREKRG